MNNTDLQIARVQNIILDSTHEYYSGENSIGTIVFNLLDTPSPVVNDSQLNRAKPFNINIIQYPLKNELVYIVRGPSFKYNEFNTPQFYYINTLGILGDPNSNSYPDFLDEEGKPPSVGDYFKEIENIYPLQPYEGDIIIKGRLGQSIRFGSTVDNNQLAKTNPWSNIGEIGDPITIIRNGQKGKVSPTLANFSHILEDINEDDSSVYLCSNHKLNITPASLHRESYQEEINVATTATEEVNLSSANNPLDDNVKEDITLRNASNLVATELQRNDELSSVDSTDTTNYDSAETEDQTIGENNTENLPNEYVPPNTTGTTQLNTTLGTEPPPSIQDQTNLNTYTP